jgi:NodT family efflux transporter outer membrane factor (OMF) lipoprotein
MNRLPSTLLLIGLLGLPLVGAAGTSAEPAAGGWVSGAFRNADNTGGVEEGAWWVGAGDPVLTALVRRALAANLDVRIARERAVAARAGERASTARLLPSIGVQAGASDARTDLPAADKLATPDTRALQGGVDVAWELDLAGGVRAARRAARADVAAAQAGVAGARLIAASEVARQYYLLRGTQERLGIVEQLAAAQRDTERLVRSREREGVASRFDVTRATGEAESLEAEVPSLRTLVGVTQTRIAVLLGENPTAFTVAAAPDFPWPAPHPIGTGQPSELLRRRPDLLAAEARFAAATGRLQEARAQWWPKLFLSALFGIQDVRLNAVEMPTARFSNVALAFALPLFDGGRIRAGVEAQTAKQQEALLGWQQAVLTAVGEVEDSLLARAQEERRAAALAAATAARRASLDHAQSLRREGQIDLLVLLDVQRTVLAAELALAESRTQQALNDIQLYKALGGGWEPAQAPSQATQGVSP